MFEKIVTGGNLTFLLGGAVVSLLLAIGALAMGLVFGTFGAMGRISKKKVVRGLATAYVEAVRGTPMLLQILFLFLGIPGLYNLITGNSMSPDPLLIGLIAMGINSGAYTTELIRSGIGSVPRGQLEAGRTIGLSYPKTMRYIVLPQAFKRIVPPLVSEFIVLIKDSSLVSVIGAAELLRRSRVLGSRYYNYMLPLLMATAMYLVMTLIVSMFARKLEARLKTSD
jgi:polar amino acid transport system permease protein